MNLNVSIDETSNMQCILSQPNILYENKIASCEIKTSVCFGLTCCAIDALIMGSPFLHTAIFGASMFCLSENTRDKIITPEHGSRVLLSYSTTPAAQNMHRE